MSSTGRRVPANRARTGRCHQLGHGRHRRTERAAVRRRTGPHRLVEPLAALGSLRARVGAIAATADQAAGKNGAQTGQYEIASLKLTLSSPALSQGIKQLTGGTSQVPGLSDLISTLASTGLPVGTLEKVGTADPVTALTKAITSFGNVELGNRKPHQRHARRRCGQAAEVDAGGAVGPDRGSDGDRRHRVGVGRPVRTGRGRRHRGRHCRAPRTRPWWAVARTSPTPAPASG
jgi:hypothetical protein